MSCLFGLFTNHNTRVNHPRLPRYPPTLGSRDHDNFLFKLSQLIQSFIAVIGWLQIKTLYCRTKCHDSSSDLAPKPTFCIYDSDDSDAEPNNNVKPNKTKEFPLLDIDVDASKYFECYLADTFFVHLDKTAHHDQRVRAKSDETFHHVPQSRYPSIRSCSCYPLMFDLVTFFIVLFDLHKDQVHDD